MEKIFFFGKWTCSNILFSRRSYNELTFNLLPKLDLRNIGLFLLRSKMFSLIYYPNFILYSWYLHVFKFGQYTHSKSVHCTYCKKWVIFLVREGDKRTPRGDAIFVKDFTTLTKKYCRWIWYFWGRGGWAWQRSWWW